MWLLMRKEMLLLMTFLVINNLKGVPNSPEFPIIFKITIIAIFRVIIFP